MSTAKATPEMSPSQRRYAVAMAAYETAIDAACDDAPDAPAGASIAEVMAADARYETARERHNVDALAAEARAAETAMVADRCDALARVYPEHAATIRETREKAARSSDHWIRIVDLCFRGCPEISA